MRNYLDTGKLKYEISGRRVSVDGYHLTGEKLLVTSISNENEQFQLNYFHRLERLVRLLVTNQLYGGKTFRNDPNLGGVLPSQPDAYYQKWTLKHSITWERGLVVGPERLVVGNGKEIYYTGDHYQTFVLLTEPELVLEDECVAHM